MNGAFVIFLPGNIVADPPGYLDNDICHGYSEQALVRPA
jgi:hypothetical protein